MHFYAKIIKSILDHFRGTFSPPQERERVKLFLLFDESFISFNLLYI